MRTWGVRTWAVAGACAGIVAITASGGRAMAQSQQPQTPKTGPLVETREIRHIHRVVVPIGLGVTSDLRVEAVAPDSIAAQSGLQVGDQLKSYQGVALRSVSDFRREYEQLAAAPATRRAPSAPLVVVRRGGRDVTIPLVRRYPSPTPVVEGATHVL